MRELQARALPAPREPVRTRVPRCLPSLAWLHSQLKNPAKLKTMSKKQLRQIKKADTTGVKPKVYGKREQRAVSGEDPPEPTGKRQKTS